VWVWCVDAACECDVTGSTGVECDSYSGQCPCRANVLGRRCDSCDENQYDVAAGCLRTYTAVYPLPTLHRLKSLNYGRLAWPDLAGGRRGPSLIVGRYMRDCKKALRFKTVPWLNTAQLS